MEHIPVRYQPFRNRPALDLACKCGERFYLRPGLRTYKPALEYAAQHFSWLPPTATTEADLTKWLIGKLPSELRPKGA